MLNVVKIETEEGIRQVAEIADIVWHETYNPLMEKEQVDYMVENFQSEKAIKRQIRQEGYSYFMVFSGDKAAGFTGLVPDYEKQGELYLSKAYVLSEFRGQGVFSLIMNKVTEFAKEHNQSSVMLTVNRANVHAVSVYEHYGFIRTCEKKKDIGKGYVMDDYIMVLKFN